MDNRRISSNSSDKEESYRLTPFGLLGPAVTGAIIQRLKMHGDNAIVWNGKDLEWARVEKAE